MKRRTLLQTLGGLPFLNLLAKPVMAAPQAITSPTALVPVIWSSKTVDHLLDLARQVGEPASIHFTSRGYGEFRMFGGRDQLIYTPKSDWKGGHIATYKDRFEVWTRRDHMPSNFVAVMDRNQNMLVHQGSFSEPHKGPLCGPGGQCSVSLCSVQEHPDYCSHCSHQRWLRAAPSEAQIQAAAQWIFDNTPAQTLYYQSPNRRWRWESEPDRYAVILQEDYNERNLGRLERSQLYPHDGSWNQPNAEDRVFRR